MDVLTGKPSIREEFIEGPDRRFASISIVAGRVIPGTALDITAPILNKLTITQLRKIIIDSRKQSIFLREKRQNSNPTQT